MSSLFFEPMPAYRVSTAVDANKDEYMFLALLKLDTL